MNRDDVLALIAKWDENLKNKEPVLINFFDVRKAIELLTSELGEGKPDNPFTNVDNTLIRTFALKLAGFNEHLMSIYAFKEFYQKCVELELSTKKRIHKGDILHWIGRFYLQIPDAQQNAFKYCILSFLDDVIAEKQKPRNNSKKTGIANAMNAGSSQIIQLAFHVPKVNLEKLREIAIKILSYRRNIYNPEILTFYMRERGYQIPRYNDYKYYSPSYPHLRERYKQIKATSDPKAWEKFAALLFSSVTGFEPILDVKPGDTSYQFDVVIRNVSSYDFSIQWLGEYFALECKYYKSNSVGVGDLDHFASKLKYHDFKCGIIFTKTPISGWKSKRGQLAGKLVQTKIFNRQGLIIFDFSEVDIKSILEGRNLIEVLFEKYEQVRLDL